MGLKCWRTLNLTQKKQIRGSKTNHEFHKSHEYFL